MSNTVTGVAHRPRVRVRDREEDRPFASFADYLQAVCAAGLAPHQQDPRLRMLAAASGASETSMTDGGYLVPQEHTDVILRTAVEGQLLARARRLPATSNNISVPLVDESSRATGSRSGGLVSSWSNEAAPSTASKPKWRRAVIDRLGKLTTLVYLTNEQMQDSTFVATVQELAGRELRWMMENAAVNGGAGQPLGIINAAGTITVPAESGQTAGTVVLENVTKMVRAFWIGSRASRSACWLVHPDVEEQLAAGAVGGDNPLLYRFVDDEPFARLGPWPVIATEYSPALGTPGDIILCDLYEYVVLSRPIDQALSLHVKFTTDEAVLRFVWRVDGLPLWNTPLTPANGTNQQSAFVMLAQR